MKRILLTISILLLFIIDTYPNGTYFNHLGIRDGISQISIMSTYQDETGAMWFGTTEGICRYNGKDTQTFTSSKKDNGLTQNIIYSITGDKKGTIYIKADYDLIRYDIAEEKFELVKQNMVKAIFFCNDVLWFATDFSIYQYTDKDKQIKQYAQIEKRMGIITSLYVSENNDVWVGSEKGISVLFASGAQQQCLEGVYTSTLFIDSRKNVWIGTVDDGIYLLNKNGQMISHFERTLEKRSLSNNEIRTILEDNSGKIWIGSFFGLNSFDPITQQWNNHIHDDSHPHSLSHSSVFSLYKDTQGTIWIGTYFGGVNYFNPELDIFHFYNANSYGKNNLSFPFVGKMTEDDFGNLWICTEGGGLNCLDLKTRQISHYLHEGSKFESVKTYNLKCIWYRKETAQLYIGIHNGGLCIFDIKTKRYKILSHNPNAKNSLPDDKVRDMQYYNGNLYILTSQGISRMDLNDDLFYPVSDKEELNEVLNKYFIYSFFIDRKENIWISLGGEIQKINLKDNTIKRYRHDEKNTRSIGQFRVLPIKETQKGKMFFGTSGSGLFGYNSETDDFEAYSVEDGLASNFCYHISELSSGNLILLNNNGLSIFDPKAANKVIFRSSNNFPLKAFFQGSSCYITKDNEIFIGGANGMVSVFESSLKNVLSSEYNLYFDKLYINNRRIVPNDETNILDKTLSSRNDIHLKHNQNNISIEFATSNYLQNTTLYYQYKLEGFDEEWYPSPSNLIVYTNINPGKYILLVREMNNDRSIGKTNQLTIYIAPPFYKTNLAYALYIILCLAAIVALVRFFIWRSRLHTALLLERQEKEQIEKLNQTKLRFFTNISHELRTPLTLIMGNTEIALQAKDMNMRLHKRITQIHKNTVHMRNLISELLDFRKQEQGFYKLKVEKTDLINYIYDIYESFSEYAAKSSINYIFEKPNDEIFAYIDPSQFRKVIYNLLSNAFKYTSPDGEITIRLKQNQTTINIQIEDDGIGIPTDAISKIFERFYQVEYRSSGFSLGTGIGLALTKEIVNSHGGEIAAKSTVSKGSIFEIILPAGKSHFNQDELVENDTVRSKYLTDGIIAHEEINELCELNTDKEFSNSEKESTKHTVLFVEDNEELLDLLSESFSPFFNVYTAPNGKVGLRMTLELQPDLVVSDVMMPEMSGKEMCYKIKNNLDILHIPVLLLTSQATTEETIEGFMYGADAYVTKPFNIELLILQCNNLIKNRLLLYQSITRQDNTITSFNLLSDSDQSLIDKATEIIRKDMSNPEFDMNQLASELGMSRSKLYTKIKDITNLTPNEFTLNLKLREALNMLEYSPDLNISDIAVTLGFSSTKYFGKCFKTFYNTSPLQWRKNKQDETMIKNKSTNNT